MPELRLTLMVAGGIFLIGLAWWELRRSHQVRGSDLPRPAPEPPERTVNRTTDWDMPALELPRMSARDPEAQLPIIEVDPADFADLEARAQEADTAPAPEKSGMEGLLDELGANQRRDPPISDFTGTFRSIASDAEPFAVQSAALAGLPEREPEPEPEPEPAAAPDAASVAAPESAPDAPDAPDAPPTPVVVEWPAPDASEVLAVRLVSTGEKFSGRAVRLALAAEGFAIGKFSIFHKPAADGRALLSIASLNKPGTFDRQSIDLQRYSGLNLFTVLPGPVSGPNAVDELLVCAQVLSQRLRGILQDEHGAPLTPSRTAAMRRNAAAAAST
jgi:FtsZ-interacting cell division protein ZipA